MQQINLIEVDARLRALAQQRDQALAQLVIDAGRAALVAAEFEEMKLQRDSAFVFLQQCFQSGRLSPEGIAAIAGLNAWIETNKVLHAHVDGMQHLA